MGPTPKIALSVVFTLLFAACGGGGGGGSGSPGGAVNQAPTAWFSVSATGGTAPLSIVCDGSASTDTDGSITSYDWAFGDGATGTGATATHTYTAAGTYTVTLTVTDDDGATDGATASVTVTPPNQPPTAQFSATPTRGDAPFDVTFDASASTDADGAVATYLWDFGDGTTATGSAEGHTFTVPGTYEVVLTVADDEGATGTATVSVEAIDITLPPPDPSSEAPPIAPEVAPSLHRTSAFLYTGSGPTQKGVDPAVIVSRRAAVLRGRVVGRDGAALAGTRVTVRDHAEFGWTLSRDDGAYDLVVNGGGPLTLEYGKDGYLPAYRQVDARWGEYARVPDVALVVRASAVTTVDLASAAAFQVARADSVTDADGTRRATVLVPKGTGAQVYSADGTLQTVTSLNIRITEYTVGDRGPNAMPAGLPPTSAYTHAFELGSDEAIAKVGGKDVVFDQPVYYYVENFLGFDPGTSAPVGYYDPDRSTWVPSANGVVLEILDVAGGVAQVDTTGDGVADNGAGSGGFPLTDAEREQLASLYVAGQTLWRVPLEHFSTWDINWGWGPPDDAGPPELDFEEELQQIDDCSSQKRGSILSCRSQTLGEAVEVVGTPFTLNYRSDRTPGRAAAYTLDIPLSGDSLPGTPVRIEAVIEVAGRQFSHTVGENNACTSTGPQLVDPLENRRYAFTWDGVDVYGRTVGGVQPVTVRVGYTYCGSYSQTDRFGYNGNGVPITGAYRGRTVTLWDEWRGRIGTWDARAAGLGGWTLDVQHAFGPAAQVLFRGDGTRRDARAEAGVIETVAGAGCGAGTDADGIPAVETRLWYPNAVELGPDGSMYILDAGAGRVRKVDPEGVMSTLTSGLYDPRDVAVGPDGTVYVSQDAENSTVSRINPDGSRTLVAGVTNYWGGVHSGVGGPATEAYLWSPRMLEVGPDGTLYIGEGYWISKVDPEGIFSEVTSGGTYGGGVGLGPGGGVYAMDWGAGGAVYRYGPGGTPNLVASLGYNDYCTDLAVAPDGTVYVTTLWARNVLRSTDEGTFVPAVGSGEIGFSPDGTPAVTAALNQPKGLAVGPDGDLYLADAGNCRVLRVKPVFDASDLLLAAEDGSEAYLFDETGRHEQTLHAVTGAVLYAFTYDADGLLVEVADADGNVTTIERDVSGDPVAIVSPYGQRTELGLDPNGWLSSVVNPAGEETRFTYLDSGLMTTYTSPRGDTSTFAYDEQGRLVSDEDPLGGVQSLVRNDLDPDGLLYEVTHTSPLGHTTTYRVERLTDGGQRRLNTRPDGTVLEDVRGADGARGTTLPDGTTVDATLEPAPLWGMSAPIRSSVIVSVPGGVVRRVESARTVVLADPADVFSAETVTERVTTNGHDQLDTYDVATGTHTLVSSEGRQTVVRVDDTGRVLGVDVAGLFDVNDTYDASGRLIDSTQGTGAEARTVSLGYGSDGNLAIVTDPLGGSASFVYDAAGRLSRQTFPDGREVLYGYDANGNLTSLTPPGRPAHLFRYNEIDLTSEYVAPQVDTGDATTRYAYDADGRLIGVTYPDGRALTYSYDASGRITALTAPEGDTAYAYDDVTGQLVAIESPGGGVLDYTYQGSLLTQAAWSGDVDGTVDFVYDNDLLVAEVTVNGADPVGYQWDTDALLVQAGELALNRDAQNGLITGTSLGSVHTAYTYDGFGEVARYTAAYDTTELYGADYTYDSLGRITQTIETVGGAARTFGYAYDAAGRLSRVSEDGAVAATYGYDANGNRTHVDGVEVAHFDAQDRILDQNGVTYTHNASGQLVERTAAGQTTRYAYDPLGNLRQVTLPDGTRIDYLVDGQNRRVGKKVDGVLVQGFLYQDQLNPVAELDGEGNVVSRFVYGTRDNVPDYMTKGGSIYRIIADRLGSPRLVVDVATGTVVQEMSFGAWGEVLGDTNPGFQPFGFAGGLYDLDTRLVRFGARDYGPEAGRWFSKDPIRFASADSNLYRYVFGDPVNTVDPSGYGLREDLEEAYKSAYKVDPESADRYLQQAKRLLNTKNILPAYVNRFARLTDIVRKLRRVGGVVKIILPLIVVCDWITAGPAHAAENFLSGALWESDIAREPLVRYKPLTSIYWNKSFRPYRNAAQERYWRGYK